MGLVKIVRPTAEKKTIHGAGDEYSFLAVGAETRRGGLQDGWGAARR